MFFFFNIIYNKFSLLHIAVQNNDIEVMKLLLEKGVIDVNYQTIQKKKFFLNNVQYFAFLI